MNRVDVVVVALATLGMVAGCDDEPADALGRVCVPGATQACFGPGRCEGAQACLAGGEGFGPCNCGTLPDAGAVDPGPLCSPGELRVCLGEEDCGGVQICGEDSTFAACDCTSRILAVNVLGAACTSDAECGPDLLCWSSATRSLGPYEGGAAHGYCTQRCASRGDCARFDPNGICSSASAAGESICLRGCLSKAPIPGEAKCLDRVDQICMSTAAFGLEAFDPIARQLGACLPNCGSDADCDGGRFCDLASGLCVNTEPFGLPIGSACALDTDCEGQVCVTHASGERACSAPCPLDSLGCGFGIDADPRGAACLAPWFNVGGFSEGRQDLGLCIELCNQTSDCNQAGFVCDTSQPTPAGSAGACLPQAEGTPGVADAGADGG